MVRKCVEYISLSAEENEVIIKFKNMLSDYLSYIEKEDAFPTLSNTYLDTQYLLEHLNIFIEQNIK